MSVFSKSFISKAGAICGLLFYCYRVLAVSPHSRLSDFLGCIQKSLHAENIEHGGSTSDGQMPDQVSGADYIHWKLDDFKARRGKKTIYVSEELSKNAQSTSLLNDLEKEQQGIAKEVARLGFD